MLPELNWLFFLEAGRKDARRTPQSLKAIKWDFWLITIGFSIKTFETNLQRTLVSPRGMARNQQWGINKWPLKNIGPLVRTHIQSRAATVHMSTHSLPISSALFAKTLPSNEGEGLQSHRAKQSSVIPECCFPSGQPGHCPPSKVILTNQDSLQHQIYEWTAHRKRNPQLTHNWPGEEIGLPGTPPPN